MLIVSGWPLAVIETIIKKVNTFVDELKNVHSSLVDVIARAASAPAQKLSQTLFILRGGVSAFLSAGLELRAVARPFAG